MNYYGCGKLESGDIRWNMRNHHISRAQLAMKVGITDKQLQDILSLKFVPDEYAARLIDAIISISKSRKLD